ncbi:redoxin family protein [Catenuloplanes atrovinosus]|uniref:Thiol-disulfide isomerase/thioredoxin n=1 Tax=Catenuloplanes atrovinosus TaxID=137266 RepID=A0AAE3YSY1_9ACTN|nr:redoxin family protein [Catenuloplanes atrovinosus]MDR7278041.1 thiol-disulfide isomerase/thioredoxin [Catenuloplanes atrovinosus]
MRARRFTALVMGAALLALGACGSPPESWVSAPPPVSAPSAAAPSAPAPAAPSEPAPTGPVPELLRFTGTTLDGRTFDGTSLAHKPAVLWFWAPWCATCAGQGWIIAEQAPRYAGRVPIVGVAGLSTDTAAMDSFVTTYELGAVPQINDGAGELWKRFEVTRQSYYVMIDAKGEVVHKGWLDEQDFVAWLDRLAA